MTRSMRSDATTGWGLLGRWSTSLVLALLVGSLLWALDRSTFWSAEGPPDFEQACEADLETARPYYVATCFRAQERVGGRPGSAAPSLVIFQDTPADRPQYALATFAQTGAIWGLAYRSAEPAIYAGAYHKRSLPFGPGGPGAIYRIDLSSGQVSQFAVVPDAGLDRHRGTSYPDGEIAHDEAAAGWVGATSLGDLELSDDESQLFVTNLADRQIYRFSVPDGQLLDAFEHGANSESWARDARPFALAFHRGALYHGVLNENGRPLVAMIYRSEPDGSNMQRVAELDLRYDRGQIVLGNQRVSLDWNPWHDADRPSRRVLGLGSAPMITDLEIDAEASKLVVALRDRRWDTVSLWVDQRLVVNPLFGAIYGESQLGFGDVLAAEPDDQGWRFQVDPETIEDLSATGHAESALGGLALARNAEALVFTAFGTSDSTDQKVFGLEGVFGAGRVDGSKRFAESICWPANVLPYQQLRTSPLRSVQAHSEYSYHWQLGSVGDIEPLCAREAPTVTPTPSATPSASPTATPSHTQPAPTATPTPLPPTGTQPPPSATPEPRALYLPLLLREACDPQRARADVVLVLDASSSMTGAKLEAAKSAAGAFVRTMRLPEDQVAVVTFSREARTLSALSGDSARVLSILAGIQAEAGTRIDRGLEAAVDVLAGPERRADNGAAVVVLTDGIQEDEAERPLAIADTLRREGAALYAVGLGADVDASYLASLTGDADRLYLTRAPEDLVEIYERIARLIPCPKERFWGGR